MPSSALFFLSAFMILLSLSTQRKAYRINFGQADVVAEHPDEGLFIAEVEGKSNRQREQAV